MPPTRWADVATTTDLDHLRVLVKADIDQLRMETRAEFADVRTDVYDRLAVVDKSVIRETSAIRVELHKTLRAHTLFLVATNLSAVGLLTFFFRG